MSGTETTYGPPKQSSGNGGTPWTPEQRAAYANIESAFAKYMKSRQPGETRWFKAKVLEIGDQRTVENTFPGASSKTRKVRTIKVEFSGNPAVRLDSGDVASPDGMRFQKDSGDNPYNDKTLLHALCRATVGEPDPKKPFTVSWPSLIGKVIEVEIEKQNPRSDGKRGGFYAEMKDIRRVVEDDLEIVTGPPTVQPTAAPAPAPAEDDSQPWA